MYPVSARFLRALTVPHTIVTEATYQPPGGVETRLTLHGADQASVTLDSQSRIRRRADITVIAGRDDFEAITEPGTLFRIRHGINFGSTTELVPVFTGDLSRGDRPRGRNAGAITLPLIDLWGWIARSDFVTPFTVASGTTRAAAIAAIVTDARPTTTIVQRAAGGTVGADKVWTGSRSDAINDLATDGALVVYFDGDGQLIIEPRPTSSAVSVWGITAIIDFAYSRPLDKLYNTVVVKPSAVDGSQEWTQQVAQVTDPTHPRHPSKIGVVPYVWSSPTAGSAAAARQAAQSILYRLLGSTETIKLGALANPALEGLDVIRVNAPRIGSEPADIYSHFVDGFTLNLHTGAMSLSTRKQATD